MDINNQFQGVFGTLFLGFVFAFIYQIISEMIKKVAFPIKIITILLIFMIFTYLYFIFLLNYTFGIFNVFYPALMFVGVILYNSFYKYNIELLIERINKTVFSPLELKLKNRFDIIYKKIRRKKNETTIKKEKQN